MNERDIWRTANLLLNQCGDDAAIQAAQRADEMLDRGDIDGQRVWRRVLAAISELSTSTPNGPLN